MFIFIFFFHSFSADDDFVYQDENQTILGSVNVLNESVEIRNHVVKMLSGCFNKSLAKYITFENHDLLQIIRSRVFARITFVKIILPPSLGILASFAF
jgi:hypothetical protein